jgi:hypothetical protein
MKDCPRCDYYLGNEVPENSFVHCPDCNNVWFVEFEGDVENDEIIVSWSIANAASPVSK